MVKSFQDRQESKAKSLSENIISKLENSTEYISIVVYKKILIRTLHWLNEDHELEEFVAGIPGLYWSEALGTRNDAGEQQIMSKILSNLPGPTSFHASLSWSIIHLAQRAVVSNSSNSIQQQRTRACLRALYCIPGAIRDVLAPYAVGKHYCLEILPLLNSPDSLEIIDELWNTPIHEIALSVRCAAAVVAAFMITPPRRVLDNFVTSNVGFIGDDNTGKEFLAKRLRVGAGADGAVAPEYDPGSDSARLGNLVRFLTDIKDTLRYMDTYEWRSNDAIRQERRALFKMRNTIGYRIGRGMFDQQGDRASPAFVPAAQQDLISLTLEIMARDSVANAATSQREAFRDAYMELVQELFPQPWWADRVERVRTLENAQARPQRRTPTQVPPEIVLELLARTQAQDADSFEMVTRGLEPVLKSLRLQIDRMPSPRRPLEPQPPHHHM